MASGICPQCGSICTTQSTIVMCASCGWNNIPLVQRKPRTAPKKRVHVYRERYGRQ